MYIHMYVFSIQYTVWYNINQHIIKETQCIILHISLYPRESIIKLKLLLMLTRKKCYINHIEFFFYPNITQHSSSHSSFTKLIHACTVQRNSQHFTNIYFLFKLEINMLFMFDVSSNLQYLASIWLQHSVVHISKSKCDFRCIEVTYLSRKSYIQSTFFKYLLKVVHISLFYFLENFNNVVKRFLNNNWLWLYSNC